MNSGKSLIIIIIIIIVLVAGWFLWRGGYFAGWGIGTAPVSTSSTGGTTATTGAGGQTGDQTTGAKTGTVGKMTDDIYIDMIVHAAYLAQKNPATYAADMKSLFDKYGITEENVTAYGEALAKDPARAQAIAAKYALELQKLMK